MVQNVSSARPQRNFLRDYDLMLKTLMLDYVDCARYETSGYSDFIGKLYTLNASMFQSPVFCDQTLTQMMLHYLTWFQDPGIKLLIGPNAAWHMASDYRVQRYGDALYVVEAAPDAPVKVGERITGVNKMALTEIRPEVERTLRTTVEPEDPEREDWSLVLAFAKHLTVVGLDGAERTVKVVPGTSAIAERMRAYYAHEAGVETEGCAAGGAPASGGATEGTEGAGSPAAGEGTEGAGSPGAADPAFADTGRAAAEPPCSLRLEGGTAVLRLANPGDPAFPETLAATISELDSLLADGAATALVIDARRAEGGAQADIYPLVPYLLAFGATARPADLFGKPGILMNCSRHNVDAKLAELAAVRAQLAAEAAGGDADGTAARANGEAAVDGTGACVDGGAAVGGAEGCTVGEAAVDPAESDAAAAIVELDSLVAELTAKRGHGFMRDETDFYDDIIFVASAHGLPASVKPVVLVDRFTADAAEWLARAAKASGHAVVAGRATAGSLDNTCPRTVVLDEDFAFVVPTAKYLGALGDGATLGRGIVPHVHIPWTPEHLAADVDLAEAVKLARTAQG